MALITSDCDQISRLRQHGPGRLPGAVRGHVRPVVGGVRRDTRASHCRRPDRSVQRL